MQKTDIYIAITTYNRQVPLNDLLADIIRDTKEYTYHVRVYDDCSDEPVYVPFDCVRYEQNNGKKGYWKIIAQVFEDASHHDFKYFFLLQDDCLLTENFFAKAIEEYESIEDPNKATLCTFTPESVYKRTMWSNRKAQDVAFSGRKFIKSNYVDCIFMCPRSTLEILKFTMNPIHPERFINVLISSGVGQQLTLRLIALKKTMYCAWSSLVCNHSNDSKMNKEERIKHPLNPLIREYEKDIPLSELLSAHNDRITVGIASIRSREGSLLKTINSLIDQVDEIHIYLNDYVTIPDFVQNNPKIKFYLGSIYKDRGDTAKYFPVEKIEDGYYFSCDDDLIYPKDYVQRTVEFLKKSNNQVIATYHGAILNKGPLENYYRNRKQIHYSNFQRDSIPVHIGGTGVMAFHVSTFKPDTKKFLHPNMSDIWVGIQSQELNIPIVCAPRPMGWIKAEDIPPSETIYGSKSNHDLQTKVINDWKKINGEFQIHG